MSILSDQYPRPRPLLRQKEGCYSRFCKMVARHSPAAPAVGAVAIRSLIATTVPTATTTPAAVEPVDVSSLRRYLTRYDEHTEDRGPRLAHLYQSASEQRVVHGEGRVD